MVSLILTLATVIGLMGCTSVPGRISTNTSFSQQSTITSDSAPETIQNSSETFTHLTNTITNRLNLPQTTPQPRNLDSSTKQKLLFLFLKGSWMEKQRQYAQAGQAYEDAIRLMPHSAYAHAVAGNVYLVSGDIEKAIDRASQALIYDINEIEAHKVMAESLIQKGKWNEAVEHYEYIIQIEPDSADVIENLALLYSQQQQYDNAIELYRQLISISPSQSILNRFKIATMLFQLNRFDEALAEYEILLELIPDYYEVSYKIGNIYEMLEQPDQAIEAYQSALTKARTDEDVLLIHNRLGLLYRTQNNLKEALNHYKKIHELDPNNFETKKLLALLYVEQEQFAEAEHIIQEIIDNSAPEFRYYLLQDEVLTRLGKDKEGISLLLQGLRRVVDQHYEENTLAFLWTLSQQHRLEQMETHDLLDEFKKCLQLKPPLEQHPRFLIAAAKLALFQKKLHGATAEANPHTASVHQSLEKIISTLHQATQEKNEDWVEEWNYELRGWYDVRLAFTEFQLTTPLVNAIADSLKIFPYEVELKRTQGTLYIDQKNWSQATNYLEEARRSMEPGTTAYEEVLFQLASVYDKMNRLEKVEILMTEAMELDPENAQAFNFLGYAFADRNIKLDEALNLVQKAVQLEPDDGNILDSLGWVYYRLKRYEEAAHYLEQAAEKEKNHPVILEHLGDVYQKLGKDKAVDYWRKALQYGPDYPFEYTEDFESRITQKIQQTEPY